MIHCWTLIKHWMQVVMSILTYLMMQHPCLLQQAGQVRNWYYPSDTERIVIKKHYKFNWVAMSYISDPSQYHHHHSLTLGV